ncbi:MAG: S46 family peptidase, partial [Sedimentisphaerales bacterium]|nr:S46 family peptidase [Sedimentisphaerales bacterium]
MESRKSDFRLIPTLPMLAFIIISFVNPVTAGEGMWLYNDPPIHLLKERYNFEPTSAWLENLQKASIRFNSGGSGSFISPDGLIISNHHVGADALHKFSDEKHNYLLDGFYARSQKDEKRCLDLELNVLISIEDVTDRVNAAVKSDVAPEEAFAARRAVMAEIEKESLEKTGLRSDVITLYQGGQYHLYRYKKYTDIRLVFAPEQQIAFFGGDPDNFEYPRFDLDFCIFRAYENDKPAKIEHFLKFSNRGVSEGDLVFVSGNPGSTSRQLTMAELEDLRDRLFPYVLQRLNAMEVSLLAYSGRNEENARRAKDLLFGVQNNRKRRNGMYAGLLDPQLMSQKQDAEQKLKAAVSQDPNEKNVLACWERITDAQRIIAQNALEYNLLEAANGFYSNLFDISRKIMRTVEEKTKPNGQRLREYRDSNLESLEFQLFSEEPIYDDFEQLKLADSLTWLVR